MLNQNVTTLKIKVLNKIKLEYLLKNTVIRGVKKKNGSWIILRTPTKTEKKSVYTVVSVLSGYLKKTNKNMRGLIQEKKYG